MYPLEVCRGLATDLPVNHKAENILPGLHIWSANGELCQSFLTSREAICWRSKMS